MTRQFHRQQDMMSPFMASLFLILIQIIIACQNSPPLSCRISVSGTEAGGIGSMLIPPGMQPPRRGRPRQSVSRQSRGGSPRGASIRSVRLDASLDKGAAVSGVECRLESGCLTQPLSLAYDKVQMKIRHLGCTAVSICRGFRDSQPVMHTQSKIIPRNGSRQTK